MNIKSSPGRIYVGEGFHQIQYQGGVKSTVSEVFEDLKFKISVGSDKSQA